MAGRIDLQRMGQAARGSRPPGHCSLKGVINIARKEYQIKARSNYRRKLGYLKVELYKTDADIVEHMAAQENKQGYLKALIRADMEKNKKEAE